MKASLLKRMLLAQALVAALVILSTPLVDLGKTYVSASGPFEEPLRTACSALVLLLQDETDPRLMRVLARRIQRLDETSRKEAYLEPGEYKPVYQIIGAEGNLIYRSENAPLEPLRPPRPGLQTFWIGGEPFQLMAQDSPTRNLRALVAVPKSLSRRMALRDLLESPVWVLVVFAVLAPFTWLAARCVLKPLRQLARHVEARNPQDLAPLEGHADLVETRPLVQALNRLFGRAQELLEGQRRFVSEAAQELRGPVAAIAARTRTMLASGEEEAALQADLAQATRIVEQLLALARLDASGPRVPGAPLDLARLARERIEALLPRSLARKQDLGYEGPPSLLFLGSEALLALVLDNLITNALQFTPEEGRITVRLRRENREIRLEVEDSGPGIPEDDREAAFERFVRLVPHPIPGAGLGLSIVRRAAELQGGTVTLRNGADGTGLRAALSLETGEAT